MTLSTGMRDPVDGSGVTFTGPDHEKIARLHWEVAARYLITIAEVYRMARVAVFGPEALDDEFNPFAEIEELQREGEQDSNLLKLALPIDEALAIWERNWEGLRFIAARTTDPEKRARIDYFLGEREAAMARLIERAQLRGRLDG